MYRYTSGVACPWDKSIFLASTTCWLYTLGMESEATPGLGMRCVDLMHALSPFSSNGGDSPGHRLI